jgi:hypothetical protein
VGSWTVGLNPAPNLDVSISPWLDILCRYRPCDEQHPHLRSPTKCVNIQNFRINSQSEHITRPKHLKMKKKKKINATSFCLKIQETASSK